DPLFVWAQPIYPYPVIVYPRVARRPWAVSFAEGVFVGGAFAGWSGWSGWGWEPNWVNRTVVVDNNFIYRYGDNRVRVTTINTVRPVSVWMHNPIHRRGVTAPAPQVATP